MFETTLSRGERSIALGKLNGGKSSGSGICLQLNEVFSPAHPWLRLPAVIAAVARTSLPVALIVQIQLRSHACGALRSEPAEYSYA